MTKDMYESLKITDLRAIAKQRGLSIGSRSRKSELIDAMLALDAEEANGSRRPTAETAADTTPADSTVKPAESASGEAAADGEAAAAGSTEKETPAPARHRRNSGREESRKEEHGNAAEKRRREPREGRRSETHKAETRRGESRRGERKGARAEGGPAEADSAPTDRNTARTTGAGGSDRRWNENRDSSDSRVSEGRSSAGSYGENSQRGSSGSVSAGREPAGNPVAVRYERRGLTRPDQPIAHKNELNKELDSGEIAHGILEVLSDGYGFIRSSNYMPGEDDIYVAPSQIRRFNLKTGDILEGNIRVRTSGEKFSALLFVKAVNGQDPEVARRRFNFEDMTPIFPNERIRLEQPTCTVAMRVMDLFCPVGKGQRGMIVSPPKAGKTTLVKEIAKSVKKNNPEIHLIILLIDERPEEVTDIKEALEGPNVEVIYSTFDELPEHHKRVSEMTIERAKRLVEQKQDVMILLDSITRLTRAYNMTEPSSGRTLSGGLDPVALHAPKRFFGAARNMREGGSLTILATALIETGSKMDDVVYEEFKGTGNMELILNRKLSERRIFPAIDLAKSGTRRDDLLLTPDEQEAVNMVRRAFIGAKGEEATDTVLDLFAKTRTNGEFVSMIRRHSWAY